MKLLATFGTAYLLVYACAVKAGDLIEVDGGMVRERVLHEQCRWCSETISFVPIALRDEDPDYAPTSSILIYSEDATLKLSFGIMKTEGKQGLIMFFHPAERPKPILVTPNLNLGDTVLLGFDFSVPEQVTLQFGERSVQLKDSFTAGKITHVVSGMNIEITEG